MTTKSTKITPPTPPVADRLKEILAEAESLRAVAATEIPRSLNAYALLHHALGKLAKHIAALQGNNRRAQGRSQAIAELEIKMGSEVLNAECNNLIEHANVVISSTIKGRNA